MSASASGPLLVGVGSRDRGDDAVGVVVARAVAALALPGVAVLEHADPSDLLDLWGDHDPVVVVDALRPGGTPGRVRTVETGPAEDPLPLSATAGRGGGTHALSVGEVAELARLLGRLPSRLVLVGVEAERLDLGAPLSAAVDAAVEEAVVRCVAALGSGAEPTDTRV